MTDQKLESIQVETTTQLVKPLMVGDIEIPKIINSPVVLTEKPKKEPKKESKKKL